MLLYDNDGEDDEDGKEQGEGQLVPPNFPPTQLGFSASQYHLDTIFS